MLRLLTAVCLSLTLVACGGSMAYEASAPLAPQAGYQQREAPEAAPAPAANDASYEFAMKKSDEPPAPPGAGQSGGGQSGDETTAPVAAGNSGAEGGSAAAGGVAATPPSPQQMLIYEAFLQLAVFEVDKSLDQVEAAARQAGGYLVSRGATEIVVRVPAAGFDRTLKELLTVGEVLRRDLKVEDVSRQARILEVRLKNAEAMRQRLTQLLATAANVQDALAVEQQLARVTGELELVAAELRALKELVAYSTIHVTFSTPKVEHLSDKFTLPFPWLPELGLSNLLSL